MTKVELHNEEMSIKDIDTILRIWIQEGDILINNISLPHNILLYFKHDVVISGDGVIKYNYD